MTSEKMTPEQAAEVVRDGDPVDLTVRGVALVYNGVVTYQVRHNRVSAGWPDSVEIVPPEPKPGEWWMVRVDGRARVMLRTEGGAWSVQEDGDDWPDGGALAVTPIRKLVFADGDRG